eukprot:TRINITY_DN10859_c0_g1_i4.p1 TRINITY_DN10859_c0_g1~~TRINITY_DN10859_c0_g1_i4.p1  ORF type:complete len:510 (+),score=197.06 TRINITY_DN10859_c0_g1_i4:188-1717(+)
MHELAAQKGSKLRVKAKVDTACHLSGSATVYSSKTETFDCMLNQTNVGANNNKFYVIQVLEYGGVYYTWTHWGRVGENGQNALLGPFDLDKAISEFKKKFKAKTANDWDNRDDFVPKAKKYTLIEMAEDDDDDDVDTSFLNGGSNGKVKVAPCTLDKPLASFIDLIFDNNMFKEQMSTLNLDTEKMPLGKLSKSQIARGYEVLEELEAAIKNKKSGEFAGLSSRFYTVIPHSFGRSVPPTIKSLETVQEKKDMLAVLADIELAQQLKDKAKKKAKKQAESDVVEQEHPDDLHYQSLNATLEKLNRSTKEFKVIEKYMNNTMSNGWRKSKLLDVFTVDRHGEDKRFAAHDAIENRKLLWHGTSVAVVAAILGSGLRIMPHSGGRVGRGIYLASEQSKSAGYVGTTRVGKKNIGIMFLVEAALGKEKHINRDDHTLKAAPKGYDCIIAKGHVEPDPKEDTHLEFDGKKVVVPQGKPVAQSKWSDSNFSQSEYLLYKESQHRIRYVLQLDFS